MNKLIQLSILSSIVLIGFKSFAQPTVSAPTFSGITHNSAVLGGTIAGSGITARGTAWKASSPVIATDNQLAEGGTAAGAYTHTRTSLPSGTQIFFVAYGTDGVGTAISSESSFYTLSAPPGGQPATFTASTASSSQINLAWGAVTATGFLIYRRTGGTAPDVTVDFVNGTAPPTTLTDGSTLVNGPSPFSSGTSFNNATGLSAGTQYSYTIVPFGYNGSNNETYSYLTASARTANAFTLSAPPSGQPATFTASTASSSQINLAWGSVTATGFLIYRRTGGTAPDVTVDFVNGNAPPTTLTDGSTLVNGPSPFSSGTSFNNTTGLSAGTLYSYTIVPFGYNGSNNETYNYLSASARTANAFTLSAPPSGQPATFTASTVSSSQINLAWGSVTASGFLIYRNTGATAPDVTVDFVNGTAPPSTLTDGSTLVNGPSPFSSGTSFNNTTGLSAGTQYSYTIVPFGYNGSNNETYSYLTASARTANAFTLSAPPSGQPATFTTSTAGETQIDLSFTPPNNGSVAAAGYAVYRRTGNTISGLTLTNGAAPPANIGPAVLVGTTPLASDVTFSDNSASAGTQYTYALIPYGYDGVNAATYNYLVTGYATAIGYTFSTVPDSHPALTATAVSASQINLSFTALPPPPPGVGNVRGYVILRRTGTDPATSSVQDGVAPASLSLGASTLVAIITTPTTSTFNDNNGGSGLTTGTQYNYAVVPFNWDNLNTPTYNYKVGAGFTYANATTLNANSTIALNGGTTTNIDYINFPTVGGTLINSGGSVNSESLGRFRITDLGGDGAPTTLTDITMSIANHSNISEIAIFDSGNNNRGQVTNPGASVSFTGLIGISAANNNNADFEIWATFRNTVVDQQVITLTITSATTTGSSLASFAATTGGTANRIRVSSNQFRFSVSGVPVTSLPNSAPAPANFAPLTVTAVDANGNIQLNRTNTVTLSLFSGTGTLNGVPALAQNLVAGTTTFPNLSITAAGAKTIRATYGIGGVSAGNISITISTPGVDVTAGTLSNSPLCYSGLAQIISPITIVESDPADFTTGGSFSLTLPPNFVFDTSVTTAPSITGNEIGGISVLSYTGTNTVNFSYSISGTVNGVLDRIVINGLRVRYIGTTNVSGVTLVRSGGTAVQAGNASSDNKIYCTLAAQNSTTVVDFTVLSVAGQPTVDPSDVAFSVTVGSVQLDGNPSGGVFSGPGVTFNAGLGAYFFSPSSVGVSTGNQIVYTYKETSTVQQCNVTRVKSFDVYASVIQGLQSQYCDNGTPDALTVLPANIPLGYELHDFLYYAGFVRSVPAPAPTYLLSYNYNRLGTNTVAYQITFTYVNNLFQGASVSVNDITAGTITEFDPTLNLSYPNRNSIQLIYRIRETLNPTNVTLYRSANTRIVNKPAVSFSLPKYSFCSNELPQQFVGTPTPASTLTDEFVTTPLTAGGISNVGNIWTFTPSSVTPGQINTPFTIRYNYTNPATGCSNFSEASVTVFSIPTAPALTEVNTDVPVCIDGGAGTFTGNGGSIYNWYVNSNLLPINRRATLASAYIPISQISNPTVFDINTSVEQTKSFYVTKTINGCESPSTTVNMIVGLPPTLTINPSTQICDGSLVNISQGAVNAVLGNGASSATWVTSGTGQFLNSSNAVIPTGPFLLGTAVRYRPSSVDTAANRVNFTLITDAPNPPCPAASQVYQVTLNEIPKPPISAVANTIRIASNVFQVEYCGNSGSLDGNTINNELSVTGTNVRWYSDAGRTTLISSANIFLFPFNTATSRDVNFYITQTQNGCESPNATLRVLLHPVPTPSSLTILNRCVGDQTSFEAVIPTLTGPAAPYTNTAYTWNFGSSSPRPTLAQITQENPVYKYGSVGSYPVSLEVVNNAGCTGKYSLPSLLEIGAIPQASFKFDNLCIGDITNFTSLPGSVFDNTSPGRSIQTYAWNFDDPSSGSNNTSNLANPSHTYNSVGKFNNVRLSVVSGLGCSASQAQQVYILPYLKNITDFPYSQNFEANDGGWAGAGFNTTAVTPVWNYGIPTGNNINATNGSTAGWFTSKVGNAYDKNVRAALNSPCIDVSKLPRPVLSFDYFNDTKLGSDGAYLESSIDGGLTWSRAGNLNQGISWYNTGPIGGLSLVSGIGQSVSQIGWSKQNTGWTESAFALDNPSFNFSNETKLRLRFIFGTDPATKFENLDGFAIDNVRLSSRNRILLIETFTNENAGRYNANADGFKSMNNEVAKVQYHTSFPTPDTQSILNPQDNNARMSFYGINSGASLIPRSFIDGTTNSDPASNAVSDFSNNSSDSWWNTFRSTRGLSVSPFDITINNPPSAQSNQVSVQLKITATLPVSNKSINLFVALVEDVSANNTFVMRKLVPNAAGIKINTPLSLGQVINTPVFTFDVPNSNPSKLGFVAWLQEIDNEKRDVWQAKLLPSLINPPTLVTGFEPNLIYPLSFYPIPADKELLISLGEAALTNTPVVMYDALGKAVHQTTIDRGQQSKTVNTQDFAPGVYIIQLETDKGTVRKKVMVAH